MKNRKWLYCVVGIILVVIAIRIYTAPLRREGHKRQEELSSTFEHFSHAIRARDYATAYSLSDQEFRNALSERDFVAQQLSLESRWGGLETSSVEKFRIDGNGEPLEWSAAVHELRHYKNGDVHLLYEFHLEEGTWRLFGYKGAD